MPVWLEVNPRSGVPIYLQLVQGVRHALELGVLQPGERLPTVRELAVELTLAPNTVVKAYAELQRLGLIEARAGVGTVVAHGAAPTLHAQARAGWLERLDALLNDAARLGLSETELNAAWRERLARALKTPVKEDA
ncbi:MAG TPA: GntR family transcriptional regulator [Deinococcales bacterium]|nr:GntR family transcriptional regulator [Deinococcales bacterium]